MASVKDITGKRFGRLIACAPTNRRKSGSVIWSCKCDCGNTHEVSQRHLTDGSTRSCGCLNKEQAKSVAKNLRLSELNIDGSNLAHLTKCNQSNNRSGVKGVSYDKATDRWRATICFKGKRIHIGRFDTLQEAAVARREAEERIFDPFLESHGKPKTSESAFQDQLRKALNEI